MYIWGGPGPPMGCTPVSYTSDGLEVCLRPVRGSVRPVMSGPRLGFMSGSVRPVSPLRVEVPGLKCNVRPMYAGTPVVV